MNFSEKLNEYINILNCSATELSNASGVSSAVISRYRNGDRIPDKNSKQLKDLSFGISELSKKLELFNVTQEAVFLTLTETLDETPVSLEQLNKNFNNIVSVLGINMSEMARYMNFDASYLSRIRNGNRKPANPELFINAVSNFIIHRYKSDSEKAIITDLIGCIYKDIATEADYLIKLSNWFSSETTKNHNYVDDFLKKLDEFNLNEYIRSINFDKLKVPSVPFHFPTTKNYYGIEEMKKGELDFFKATVFSKSKEPVLMCSDMPLEDMAEDTDFGKKWMFAIAMMLKKGLHLNIIHNVNRPFNEMMLGLESWIPIYMTGQISPYYLKGIQNNIYCHFNYTSGDVALGGESIAGFHSKGKYYLTNNKEEVAYYKEKTSCLLKKAQPLMEIYRKDSSNIYNAFIKADAKESGIRQRILSTLPIFTIKEEMLINILKRNSISDTDKNMILKFVLNEKNRMETIIKNSDVLDEITELSKEEFENYPLSLSLSGLFYEKKIYYTYEEYLEHLKLTKEYSDTHPNYIIQLNNKNAFRNIEIFIHKGKYVMISKNTDPTIHFVIQHSKLCNALENFIAPIIEN